MAQSLPDSAAARAASQDGPAPLAGALFPRPGLCQLAQPCLRQPQHTPRFGFADATVLQVVAGQLDLDTGQQRITVATPGTLLLVDAATCADLRKTPPGPGQAFRSCLLSLAPDVVAALAQAHASRLPALEHAALARPVVLDDELATTWQQVLASVRSPQLSDARLHYRLLDLLLALAERGQGLRQQVAPSTGQRLQQLLAAAPAQPWTAETAGRALAMSAATLRRRLAREAVRFDDVLVEVRMHHALMLLQTTRWRMPHVAQACGYQSRARFADRFRARFGYLPSAVR